MEELSISEYFNIDEEVTEMTLNQFHKVEEVVNHAILECGDGEQKEEQELKDKRYICLMDRCKSTGFVSLKDYQNHYRKSHGIFSGDDRYPAAFKTLMYQNPHDPDLI